MKTPEKYHMINYSDLDAIAGRDTEPARKVKRCKFCGARLSIYNDGDTCFHGHDGKTKPVPYKNQVMDKYWDDQQAYAHYTEVVCPVIEGQGQSAPDKSRFYF